MSGTGQRDHRHCPSTRSAYATTPTISEGTWVAPTLATTCASAAAKLCPPAGIPSSSGSWLTAITMPAPILKPVSTVSEMKCTIAPQRIAAAKSATSPASSAVAAAMPA